MNIISSFGYLLSVFKQVWDRSFVVSSGVGLGSLTWMAYLPEELSMPFWINCGLPSLQVVFDFAICG